MSICIGDELNSSNPKRFENRMLSKIMEPVLAVIKIGFTPVHDTMPVTSSLSMDCLANVMRFLQKVVIKPDSRKASICNIGIYDFMRSKGFMNREFIKCTSSFNVWRARAERI